MGVPVESCNHMRTLQRDMEILRSREKLRTGVTFSRSPRCEDDMTGKPAGTPPSLSSSCFLEDTRSRVSVESTNRPSMAREGERNDGPAEIRIVLRVTSKCCDAARNCG